MLLVRLAALLLPGGTRLTSDAACAMRDPNTRRDVRRKKKAWNCVGTAAGRDAGSATDACVHLALLVPDVSLIAAHR
jgi:hypothetical protein